MNNELVQKYIGEIGQRPDEMLTKAISAITELRQGHVQQRIVLEAEFKAKFDEMTTQYRDEKNAVNSSIQALERQLSDLRTQWAKLNDEQIKKGEELKAEWAAHDEAQRKLIDAEGRMIEDLRS